MAAQVPIGSFLKGKNVVLVGPAASLKGSRQGKQIDSADVVVRVNLSCPIPDEMKEDIGSRTDILYHVLFGKQHNEMGFRHTGEEIDSWKSAGIRYVVTRHGPAHARVRAIRPMLSDKIPLITMTQPFLNKCRRMISAARSPNTGVLAICWLLESGVKSLYVTGFDFYHSGYYTGYGGFDEERAAQGVGGRGLWGVGDRVPHPQESQLKYLKRLYHSDKRLNFDDIASQVLGIRGSRDDTVTALVPIKEHSERVPGKNMRKIQGRPLLYWMLTALHRSHRVKQIVVDTDSELIARMVRKTNSSITILMRPEHLHGGHVTANDLIKWELSQLDDEQHFLFTHVTSPLLHPNTIDQAIGEYFHHLKTSHDSLFGVTEHHTRLFDSQGKPMGHDPNKLMRTQDLEPLYEDNSSMYVFSRNSFKRADSRIGHSPIMFPVPKDEAVDIDTEEDFRIASALLKWKGHK